MTRHPYRGLRGSFGRPFTNGVIEEVVIDPQGVQHVTLLLADGSHLTDYLSSLRLNDPEEAAMRLGAIINLVLGAGQDLSTPVPPPPESAPPASRPAARAVYVPPGETLDRRDTREDFYPQAEDRGQHDAWKRWAYLTLYRFLHPDKGIIPAQFATGTAPYAIPLAPIFPLEMGLAEACRRLGFARIFGAASAGEIVADDAIHACYVACVQATAVAVEAIMERNAATLSRYAMADPAMAAAICPVVAVDLAATYDPGDWARPDLDLCPPLAPLKRESSCPHLSESPHA